MYPSLSQFLRWAAQYRAIPLWLEPELPAADLLDWAHALIGSQSKFFLLHSTANGSASGPAGQQSRYSYIALEGPRHVAEGQIGELTLRYLPENGARHESLKIGNPLERFHQWMEQWTAPRVGALPPFWGGAVGYLGYECARYVDLKLAEILHPRGLKPSAPSTEGFLDLEFGVYDAVGAVDHARRKLWLVHTVMLPDRKVLSPAQLERMYRSAQDRLRRQAVRLQKSLRQQRPWGSFQASGLRSDRSPAAYGLMVRRAKGKMAAGELDQCHLSQSLSAAWEGDPWSLYRRLTQIQPSPYAALWRSGSRWMVSASPELLLRKEADHIETRSIAGIYPKGVHLGSDICTRLAPGKTWVKALQACFPGGRITGCPKVCSIALTQKLEPQRRGPYTGSLGWINFNGDLSLNVLIYTFFLDQGRLRFPVGASIHAGSDPQGSYDETLYEAEALLKALQRQRVGGTLSL
jgi:anthranilate/para-aminobenzoate synthase component I